MTVGSAPRTLGGADESSTGAARWTQRSDSEPGPKSVLITEGDITMTMKKKFAMVAAIGAFTACAFPMVGMATTRGTAGLYFAGSPSCFSLDHAAQTNTCSGTESIYLFPVNDAAGDDYDVEVNVVNPSDTLVAQCEVAGTYADDATPSYSGLVSVLGSGAQTITISAASVPFSLYIYCTVPSGGTIVSWQFN
jgi:hypothetical protein